MKKLLHISIKTLDWTEGNHSWFDAKLKPDTSIEVHWGDGSHSILRHNPDYPMCRVAHYYTGAEGKKLPFEIEFLSEDEESLLWLIDGTWENEVNRVVFDNCPALTYLQYTQLDNVDFKGCPNLETLVVNEYYPDHLDLSMLPRLKKVICRSSRHLTNLDLTKNPSIEELDISHCYNLRKVVLSNSSRLRVIANSCCEHEHHSLKFMKATVERNGGRIQEDWLDTGYLSSGCYGEEI